MEDSGGHAPNDPLAIDIEVNRMRPGLPGVIPAVLNQVEGEILRKPKMGFHGVDEGRVVQEPAERHAESIRDLMGVRIQTFRERKGFQPPDIGVKSIAERGVYRGGRSEELHLAAADAQLFAGFPKGGLIRPFSGFQPAAGQADLSGLALKPFAPHLKEHVKLPGLFEERYQHGKLLEEAVGGGLALQRVTKGFQIHGVLHEAEMAGWECLGYNNYTMPRALPQRVNEEVHMKHIFVADDEPRIRELIEKYLVKEGYRVTGFSDGKTLVSEVGRLSPDLVVLDIGMPGLDGLEACREIRRVSDLPVIFVTARDEEVDRILGLELGGDDYLTKPFSPRELVARIRNIFRRLDRSAVKTETAAVGNLAADPARRAVTTPEAELKLTTKEYELLEFFIRHPDMPFTREQLLEKVWGYDYPGELRAVDDLVKRLRKKMKEAGATVSIETVWGYGYKIASEA